MINPMDMTGCHVLVTGASSGIGRETAVCLSQLGARLLLIARDHNRLEETASLLEGQGHHFACFDLTRVEEIPEWLKGLAVQKGHFNGLVHSAGIQMTRPIQLWNRKDHDDLMTTNVTSCFALAKGFRQRGVCQQGSSIVFLASITGLVGAPGLTSYCASKGAVVALVRALALEFVRYGIRVNCVAPGHVSTEMAERVRASLTPGQVAAIDAMYPLGPGNARDVANAVAFLLAQSSRWITGTALVVDGGCTAR